MNNYEFEKLPNVNKERSNFSTFHYDRYVYIIGGSDGKKCISRKSECERYDVADQKWELYGYLNSARYDCGVVRVGEWIYVFAGMNGGYVMTIERKNVNASASKDWELVEGIQNSNLL